MTVPRTFDGFGPVFDELCQIITHERGGGRGVYDNVYALLRRDVELAPLVGIDTVGERVVWHHIQPSLTESAMIEESSRRIWTVHRDRERFGYGKNT